MLVNDTVQHPPPPHHVGGGKHLVQFLWHGVMFVIFFHIHNFLEEEVFSYLFRGMKFCYAFSWCCSHCLFSGGGQKLVSQDAISGGTTEQIVEVALWGSWRTSTFTIFLRRFDEMPSLWQPTVLSSGANLNIVTFVEYVKLLDFKWTAKKAVIPSMLSVVNLIFFSSGLK